MGLQDLRVESSFLKGLRQVESFRCFVGLRLGASGHKPAHFQDFPSEAASKRRCPRRAATASVEDLPLRRARQHFRIKVPGIRCTVPTMTIPEQMHNTQHAQNGIRSLMYEGDRLRFSVRVLWSLMLRQLSVFCGIGRCESTPKQTETAHAILIRLRTG